MIHLTRLNHTSVVLNSDLIEYVETTPDTVIRLTTGQKMVVLESVNEIVDRVVQYRRSIFAATGALQERSAAVPEGAARPECHGRS